MIQVGEKIKLNNNKEYLVINKMNLHHINYIYLMSLSTPLELIIATEKLENGSIIIKEIKDNSELDYILSQLSLSKED